MKKIDKGIVYSYDIYRILKGYNSLDFKYNGLIIPSYEFIKKLRLDFLDSVSKIYDDVNIIDEESMTEGIYRLVNNIIGRYPHCIIG